MIAWDDNSHRCPRCGCEFCDAVAWGDPDWVETLPSKEPEWTEEELGAFASARQAVAWVKLLRGHRRVDRLRRIVVRKPYVRIRPVARSRL